MIGSSTGTTGRHHHHNANHKKYNNNNCFGVPMTIVLTLLAFLLGCIVSGSIVLNFVLLSSPSFTTQQQQQQQQQQHSQEESQSRYQVPLMIPPRRTTITTSAMQVLPWNNNNNNSTLFSSSSFSSSTKRVLEGVRVLVALVAFDFSQIPHLEEVLDSYFDLAIAGTALVHVVIHTTVPYPVTLIDMWNDRFQLVNNDDDKNNNNINKGVHFQITIAIKPKSLRLHLVDCHRKLFYDHLSSYDLFIYSEDDIRVTPTTVASYLSETKHIEHMLLTSSAAEGETQQEQYLPSDFNVGIVRYEYNYPANVIIDDNTRHATQNVTRVYWEHSSFERPHIVPNAVQTISQLPLAKDYVAMKNHHQGMYLATASLLQAWKERCRFHIATNRPGKGSQPTEGTQRVWMSSQMLYGKRHCHVQQVLPMQRFGTLTVWHLPNKNYRRVGKYRNRQFADGTEVFEQPHASLLKAMELHLALKKVQYKKNKRELSSASQQRPVFSSSSGSSSSTSPVYKGVIRMVDEVDLPVDRTKLLERRLQEYQAYVERGGILSKADMTRTALMEPDDS
ncbi:hypothetical protein ACA910_013038 [Epithemia clementina (nom. ined.)]